VSLPRDSHASRYASREEQLRELFGHLRERDERWRRPRCRARASRELFGHLRERDERVREALSAVLTGATPRLLAAVDTLVGFVGSRIVGSCCLALDAEEVLRMTQRITSFI
jgi:hypothetical protein